jgi:hypothetical protein
VGERIIGIMKMMMEGEGAAGSGMVVRVGVGDMAVGAAGVGDIEAGEADGAGVAVVTMAGGRDGASVGGDDLLFGCSVALMPR